MDKLLNLLNEKLSQPKKQRVQLQNCNNQVEISKLNIKSLQEAQLNQYNTLFQSLQSQQPILKLTIPKPTLKKTFRPHFRNKVTPSLLSILRTKFQQYQDFRNDETSTYRSNCKSFSFSSISRLLNIAPSTVKSIYNQYQNDPLFSLRLQKIKQNNKINQKLKRFTGQLSRKRIKFIDHLFTLNPFMVKRQIAQQMNKHIQFQRVQADGTRKKVTISTIKKLQDYIGYTRKRLIKRPNNRNSPQNIQKRYCFCLQLQKQIQKNSQPYFLSCTKFNLLSLRDVGYAKTNQQLKVPLDLSKIIPSVQVNLIVIAGQDSIIDWKTFSNSQNFNQVIVSILQCLSKIALKNSTKKILVLDENLLSSNSSQLTDIILKNYFSILYLPPQSPLLNPIDYWFHELRSKIRRKSYITQQLLTQQISQVVQNYKSSAMETYFQAARKYVEESLRKVPLR